MSRFGPIEDIDIDLMWTFRGMQRCSGTGPAGMHNEFLHALARSFPGRKAAKVMEWASRFARRVVKNALPVWNYWVATSVRMLAMAKSGAV